MLNIATVGQLADILQVTVSRLEAVAKDAEAFYDLLFLIDPSKPFKRR